MSWVMNLSVRDVVQKLRDRGLPNLHHLPRSRVRHANLPDFPLGETRQDGIACQDITRLTFPDASLDLIVSSDVLEHVPD